jgi:hypothetical protein
MRFLVVLAFAPLLSGQAPAPALRLVASHPFRQGELIEAEMTLPAQWQFAGMLLDPPAGCGTRERPCFPEAPGGMDFSGLVNGPHAASARRTFALNLWLPPLAPGRYRVAVLSRSMNEAPVASAAVEIEIVTTNAEWVREAIARSVASLRGGDPRDAAGYQAQRDAAEQLAILNDRAAWTASLDLLPREEGVLLAGLARGRPASAVCELMQARVPAAAQTVSQAYLYRLGEICARANLPPMPPLPSANRPVAVIRGEISTTPRPVAPQAAPPNPELQAWFEKQRAYTEGVMNSATAALAGSLGSKQPAARWEAFATLLQRIQQLRNSRPPAPDPAWTPLLIAEFVRDFAAVETARKQYLLDMFSATVDSPELAPLLERVLDSWKPGDYYEAAHSALRALARLDPVRARSRILAELVKDTTWLDTSSLDLLPASEAPPMDDALIQALARAQRPGGWNPPLRMAAIARYATPKALPRIRAIYESQQDRCQPELVAYFVRVDPASAERIFRSHPWDVHAMPPPCTIQYFQRTPPLAMSPALEQYLAAYLMHEDVFIKSTAAKALARYGTSTALPPLWEAFRYFHNYWNGKGKELEQNGQGVALEVDLRNAIARGRGWLATESDLRLIESLCVSNWCIGETRHDLAAIQPPLALEVMPGQYGVSGRVAQYSGFESVAALEEKLAQYPRGTRFLLYAAPTAPKEAAEVRRFAAGKGLIVTER